MLRRFVAHGRLRHFRRLDVATRLDLHGWQNGAFGFDSFAAGRHRPEAAIDAAIAGIGITRVFSYQIVDCLRASTGREAAAFGRQIALQPLLRPRLLQPPSTAHALSRVGCQLERPHSASEPRATVDRRL